MLDPNKTWGLFVQDPVDFIIVLGAVIAFFSGGAWWLRGFIGKERLQLWKDSVDKAQADLVQVTDKLGDLERRHAELVKQIQAQASQSVLIANATSTSTGLSELRIVTNHLQGTLTFSGVGYDKPPFSAIPRST